MTRTLIRGKNTLNQLELITAVMGSMTQEDISKFGKPDPKAVCPLCAPSTVMIRTHLRHRTSTSTYPPILICRPPLNMMCAQDTD